MMRLISGVRAVLGRADAVAGYRETDRLAATLAFHWAGDVDPDTPIGRLVETGAISDATVEALYGHLVALEQADPPLRADGGWADEAVVRAAGLCGGAPAARAGPRLDALRDQRIAARIFR